MHAELLYGVGGAEQRLFPSDDGRLFGAPGQQADEEREAVDQDVDGLVELELMVGRHARLLRRLVVGAAAGVVRCVAPNARQHERHFLTS